MLKYAATRSHVGPKFWQCGHHGAKNSNAANAASSVILPISSSAPFAVRCTAEGANGDLPSAEVGKHAHRAKNSAAARTARGVERDIAREAR